MTGEVEPDLKLEIAHILTLDVVAYSTLLMGEQSRLMTALNRTVRETLRFRKAESEGGLLRLPTGDGMVLVFQSDAEAPLECAKQIAAALKEHPEIQLRMGIHSGPINTIHDVNDRVNVAGAGIDTAQRVMDCGDAGHILVSKHVAEDLAPYPRWNPYLHDLGECEVKHGRKISLVNFYGETFGNSARPQKLQCEPKPGSRRSRRIAWTLAALALALLAAAIAGWSMTRSAPPNSSIAVLPFVDVSPAKDQEYFSDGISEQIINSLAKVHGLFVVARTSSFALKNKNLDVREVGQRLHVNHVLEGSVSHGPGKFRVDVRLVDVRNGYQIWSESYDSSDQNILSVQSNLAQEVAAALRVELKLGETQRIAAALPHDSEAYDLYLRGRYLQNKRTTESIEKALNLFEEAVEKDPRFALGHAGIADSYILLGEYGALSVKDAASRAWPEVTAALEIEPHLAEGHISRAILLADFEWKWAEAEAEFRNAIKLDPNSATAHHWLALQLAQLGRTKEALKEIAIAQEHDPLSPIIRAAKAKILLVGRRFESAIAESGKTLELEPDFAPAYSVLAQASACQQQYPEALSAAKKYVALAGGGDQERLELAYVQALAGQKVEAKKIVEQVQSGGGSFSTYDMAAISVALDDHPAALGWLERAIKQRSIDVEWMGVDPRMDALREKAGFSELLAAVIPPPPHE